MMQSCQQLISIPGDEEAVGFVFHGRHMVDHFMGNRPSYYGWAAGWYTSTLYNHVAPPNWNHWDCGLRHSYVDTPGEHAIVTANSQHPGGVGVLFGDGSVRFVKDTIALPTWRALATRSGAEILSSDSY